MRLRSLIPLVLSFIALLIFALNAFCVWNWGDDYLFKVKFKTFTPIGFLWNDYWIFDGRSLNLGYLISRNCLNTPWPWLATSIASVFFFFSSFLLTYLVAGKGKIKNSERFVLTITFNSILWLAGFYSHFETLYWQTGMLYVVEVFLFYAAYCYLNKTDTNYILLAILCFIAGMASPGAVMAILSVLLAEYLYLDDSKHRKNRIIAFSGFISGLLLVVLSPGSRERFKLEGGFDDKSFSYIHDLYFRMHQFIDKFFELNTPMFWILIVSAIFLKVITDVNSENSKGKLNFIYEYRWLIAVMISLMFYFPRMLYYITSPRLNIHIVFFTMLFFVTQLVKFRDRYQEKYNDLIFKFQFPVLIVFIIFAFYQFWGSLYCVKKMEARIQLYKSNKGRHLVLKANDLLGPPATREFIDITEDSAYALNVAVAQYFGLKSIRKEKYR